MKIKLAFAALILSAPLAAQDMPPPDAMPAPAAEEEGGLTGSVTDESDWQDLGIAIPGFATDQNVSTPANSGGTAALGRELARVITSDLRDNALFVPTGPDVLPQPTFPEITAPQWPQWTTRNAEMLVHGFVQGQPDGRLTVGCYLYDVALNSELVRGGWTVAPADWRRAAHKCADLVYSRLSGESPFFDSKIAYIAETGPKDKRVKRLAIMDSDGANHRFLTTGRTTALTPRYSPDYSKILYLSYDNGGPSIYVYDLRSATQRLVVQNKNPTFAPRWSPDGQSIIYSMAIGGNTDIYRVPVSGGTSRKLTDSPGIDIGGSFSPDGSRIVFESDRSGSQQVYIMNADGSNQRRLSFFGGRAATPEWSPRGDQIAFTHMAGNFRIAVMSPNGENMRYLTNSWQDEAPTWAPNGRIIQFFRTERGSGRAGLYQVDLTGKNLRRLNTPADASDPAWGPVLP